MEIQTKIFETQTRIPEIQIKKYKNLNEKPNTLLTSLNRLIV
jgi:hypothetical protein